MDELFEGTEYFGILVTLGAYEIGAWLSRKYKSPLVNPLLISVALIIAFLMATGISYNTYNAGAKYITFLLTPTTVCLAVPLYEKFEILKKNALAVLCGIASGVLSAMASITAMCLLFGFSHEEFVTCLPKSVTSAIGMGISEELGGFPSVTVVMICLTGLLGNVMAVPMLKFFRITDPVAKGVAIGTSSHASGTARAMEIGKLEGAVSGLSIAVAGIMTSVAAPVFAALIK